jgi:hypothetical protein
VIGDVRDGRRQDAFAHDIQIENPAEGRNVG